MYRVISFCLLLGIASAGVSAEGPGLPEDPRQSINFWRAHTLDPADDERVALAQRVFRRLLRAWDSSRVEPGLYVVGGDRRGPWAASLSDGNILLSRDAIDVSLANDAGRGEHLLAFVLAHELAHQRADDLWHQRFFRGLGDASDSRRAWLDNLTLDRNLVNRIERIEAQADRDGLVLMASVGFDPWQIVDQRDFFSSWVESLWGANCALGDDVEFRRACDQARARALHAQLQLETVASQVAVYNLGVEAMVAGDPQRARHYFTLYGREFPGRAAMSAIGYAWLGEAMDLRRRIDRLDGGPAFYFPLLLDAAPGPGAFAGATRSAARLEIDALRQKLALRVERAVEYLGRASRLDPGFRPLYLSMAMAHLLEGNAYLVRGVLLGRYLPRFGEDPALKLLLAMNEAQEGNIAGAVDALAVLAAAEQADDGPIAVDLLRYTATFNLAEIYRAGDRPERIAPLWQDLAQSAQRDGRSFLFRLSLQRLGVPAADAGGLARAPTVRGVRLGDRKPRDDSPHRVGELWIEGDQFHVYVYRDGERFVSGPDGRIVSAAQQGGRRSLGAAIAVGDAADRPLKVLGIPDRRLSVGAAEYLAYDRYGVAVKLESDRIDGWFLYLPPAANRVAGG